MEILGRYLKYPYAELGTATAIILAILIYYVGRKIIADYEQDYREQYRKRQVLLTLVAVVLVVTLIVLWARLLQHTGAFLGLLGGGLAIALREPLLAIAGRIAILAGHAYSVGDRIQVQQVAGDVIDVGFFYTRMMEIGNWIGGDQATGRIVQFSNSKIFGDTLVYNYTRHFSYIWDEMMLPVTYASELRAAKQILLDAGDEYTKEFLQGAQDQLEAMRAYFLVPSVELKPQVFLKVTSNWVELRMRYVVDPKKRRVAGSFIWEKVLDRLATRRDISIASATSDVTIHWQEHNESPSETPPDSANAESRQTKVPPTF